ncbi:hypothetical protein [Streptomyces sp. NPDC001661]
MEQFGESRLALPPGRTRRSDETVEVLVRVTVSSCSADPLLRWDIELDNQTDDHRLCLHLPSSYGTDTWTGYGHGAFLERPVAAGTSARCLRTGDVTRSAGPPRAKPRVVTLLWAVG